MKPGYVIKKIVYAGGGYFGEPDVKAVSRYYWYFRNYNRHLSFLKKHTEAEKCVLGVGFGPISNKFFIGKVFDFFESCRFVYLRDEESLDYLKKYGYRQDNIHLGTDVALDITNCIPGADDKKISGDPKIYIHCPVISPILSKRIKPVLEDILRRHASYPITIISDSAGQNNKIKKGHYPSYRFIQKTRTVDYELYEGPEKILKTISEGDEIFTTKLHVGIVGAVLGKNVYSTPEHPKTKRFYRSIGQECRCNPIKEFRMDHYQRFVDRGCPNYSKKVMSHHYQRISEMKNSLKKYLDEV